MEVLAIFLGGMGLGILIGAIWYVLLSIIIERIKEYLEIISIKSQAFGILIKYVSFNEALKMVIRL